VDKLLPHLAFRHGCRVVLVVGLPGSGKSYVRTCLAAKLSALSIKTRGLTDYVFAYRDFLHEVTMLGPGPAAGFVPHFGGGFIAPDEAALAPALRALGQAARDSLDENEVTLVEFARADLVRALHEFESLRVGARVIHVMASETLRADRLNRRAEPPESILHDGSITLRVSDNHALPSTAARTLYRTDGIAQLRTSRQWGSRVFEIDNDLDDGGARINAALDEFVESILRPYRSGEATSAHQPVPA
jgi:dephospho-CoA kinase